jgi:argininosuccinate synthase
VRPPPLSHSATHTIKDIQQRITTEVTIDSHSSEPDQESKAEEGDEGEYSEGVIDYARGTGYTPERAKEIMDNIQRKLEIRRQREKSGNHNRPTTAFNPKPY